MLKNCSPLIPVAMTPNRPSLNRPFLEGKWRAAPSRTAAGSTRQPGGLEAGPFRSYGSSANPDICPMKWKAQAGDT